MDKNKGVGSGVEVGMARVGGVVGRKWRQLNLNNNKKCLKNQDVRINAQFFRNKLWVFGISPHTCIDKPLALKV